MAGTDEAVSIREYLEDRIDGRASYLHGELESHTRRDNLISLGFALFAAFAWKQIQEHLSLLNNENARVAAVIKDTVSADTYRSDELRRTDERVKLDDWRGRVDGRIAEAATKEEVKADVRTNQRAGLDTGTRLIQIGILVVALVISYLGYRVATHPVAPSVVTVTVPTTTNP